MAEVFLARQRGPEGFDRRVAVKRILPHLVETGDFVRMFLDEARLAARLSHPNVVHIYEFGKVEEYFFIAMEYVDGVDASRLIALGRESRKVPPEIVARVGADAAAGLHHAHMLGDADGRALGIVHRDVSPQNLLITYDGVVKIVDFGIAKATHQAEQTRPGVVKGKFAYMSPEQTVGKSLDGRSDVFSLGLVLWELLAGRVAVSREDPVEAMKVIRDGRLPAIETIRRDVPAALAAAVGRALSRDREDRPTAAQLGLELEGYLKGAAGLATSMFVAEWVRANFPREIGASGSHAALPAQQGTVQATAGTLAATAAGSGATAQSTPAPEVHDTGEATAVILGAVQEPPAAVDVVLERRRRWITPAAILVGLAAAAVFAFVIYPRLTAGESSIVPADPAPASLPAPVPAANIGAPGAPQPLPQPIVTSAGDVAGGGAVGEAALDIVTTPRGASLRLDGAKRPEKTPLRIAGLTPGRHDLVLQLDGHLELARSVDLAAGERRTLELTLARKPEPPPHHAPRRSTGWLTVRTIPWSEVYLGSRKLGTTPLADLELPAGTHTLTFKNPQAKTTRRRVTIRPGATTKLSLELQN